MKEYYYYLDDGKLNRFHIERDDNPWNPRKDMDGNVGTMACFHRDYDFSDNRKETGDDPDKFLSDLIRDKISDKTLINLVRKGKIGNNLEIKYNRKEQEYELLGDYQLWTIIGKSEVTHGVLASSREINWLVDDIIDALSIGDKIKLLETNGYYFLPLAIYDHSGVTMWVGSRWQGIDAQWDCSDVGWIYTTKDAILKTGGCLKGKKRWRKVTNRNWKEAADTWLRGEIKMYDQYLTGEVYGFINEEWNGEDWNEDDSCWGFYSDKWGDELAREIANDGITGNTFISEEEAEEIKDRFTAELETDKMACMI